MWFYLNVSNSILIRNYLFILIDLHLSDPLIFQRTRFYDNSHFITVHLTFIKKMQIHRQILSSPRTSRKISEYRKF